MAAPRVAVYTAPPEILVELLARSHHLLTLPLIRRLQFAAKFSGGITEHARILWCSPVALEEHPLLDASKRHAGGQVGVVAGLERGDKEAGDGEKEEVPFAAAYLDFSRGPETELWIYSSMERCFYGIEDGTGRGKGEDEGKGEKEPSNLEREEIACAVALLREVKRQQDLYFVPGSPQAVEREFPTILIGNLNEVLRERLVAPDVRMDIVSTGLYDKWIFEVGKLPDVKLPEVIPGSGGGDGEGRRWAWDIVRKEDVAFTISRTKIPRKERTMKLLSSTALYLDDGKPIAWAFLGPDSSLSSLHCEEPYRGRGIAKAVAVRVLRDHLTDYGDDAYYGWADVAPDNLQSQSVCRSLNGQPRWQISWSRMNLDTSFPEK
ncbi:hypothetical protein F5Y01DRAFT_309891 [Xylaria sp. FL0043]|nr:hypothetical protein F5Y01DRAFT_309891 [Xylaria sp. FL0043]